MTDVYISYAREDREIVRKLSEMLRFEGWDVWMDPTEPSATNTAALDMKLGSAGAILVVWSGYSRGSENVRSEAATGLYKNKLIQMRIDGAAPPRPFDQVEVVDMGRWSGERDDPNWRRIVSAVRLYAGVPGSARPQVTRRAAAPQPKQPVYLEPKRSVAWAPLIAVGVLVLGGAGVWLGDPFGWRTEGGQVAETVEGTQAAPLESAAVVEAAAGPIEDTEESAANWTRVNRDDSMALRDYVSEFPRSSTAETARSLLRVRDAQAWVKAVTADNDGAYQAYLTEFPAKGVVPGAMSVAASDRLTSLSAERSQAIKDIQSGLTALSLYDGSIDGQGGDDTVRAAKQFAGTGKKSAPQLSTAAPRDLRAFADAIQKAAGTRTTKAPIIATATTTTTTTAAAEADRQRVAQAQAAAQVATQSAAAVQPAAAAGVDALASVQQDGRDWAEAARVGTAAAYQSYLTAHPTGAQAAVARSALARISSKPAAFSLDQISGEVKTAAEAARRAQASANARASEARDAATAAASAPGARSIVAANGDQYEAQISGGAPNGLGVRVSGSAANAGDRYRGELRDGQSSGVGVYEFGANPNNTGGASRYEGEHVRGGASGYGVTYWRNGDSFAGLETTANGQSRGVLSFANGQKYEGELRDGTRNGFGVVWGPDGALLAAGRWANGDLVEPMKAGQ